MLNDLVIINLRPDNSEPMPSALTNLQWQTCLRRIVFLHRSELSSLATRTDFEIYRGREAYRFLLEVICGLHSPLVGENAVMGQFRKFRTAAAFPKTEWGQFLRTLTTELLVDARHVRHQHLQNLGSQSYGSLIRRHLKGVESVAVVGAGNLAREILPWLTNARVFYRSQRHANDLPGEFPRIQFDQFTMADAGWKGETASLVIAAPLNSTEINQWLALQKASFSLILDLRGSAGTDPIHSSVPVINLSELLASLQDERQRIAHRVVSARAEIEALVQQRDLTQESSTQENCKSQIQTRSEARGSLPLLGYLELAFGSRDCTRRDMRAPSPHSSTVLRSIKAIACLMVQRPAVPNQL